MGEPLKRRVRRVSVGGPLKKTVIVLLTVFSSVIACSDSDHGLKLAQSSGKAPFVVQIKGPKRLLKLSTGHRQKWIGCGYYVLWGDGPNSSSPSGSDCADGLTHTFKEPGSYTVQATIYHLGPADEQINDWSSTAVVNVSAQ